MTNATTDDDDDDDDDNNNRNYKRQTELRKQFLDFFK